ncbi:MarR family winged helix-turn-helix transcriptional regulator [Micromonospora sp. NPDC018662]|uniref:MarR family winged helix-turn-helix transcriptional regulator n=1 Tax=Micromonospora sp. NPDC018662 TaxID=3364238 RepID=UPI00379665FA
MAGNPVDQNFLTTLSLVSRRLKSEAERRLIQHGVHAGQQFILECLWDRNGLTPGEIAQRIKVEAPTVTRAIQRMEASGLVVVGADESDGRRVRIWLTHKGVALRKVVPQVVAGLQDDALAKLSANERTEFVRLLGLVSDALATTASGRLGDEAPAGVG